MVTVVPNLGVNNERHSRKYVEGISFRIFLQELGETLTTLSQGSQNPS
jgi:hypothetical protein